MTTATQIIEPALGLLGIRTAADPVSGADATIALDRLNTLIDALKTGSLNAYVTANVSGTLPASTATRTIGPTGQIIAPELPVMIDHAYFTTGGLDYVIEQKTKEEYDSLILKAVSSLGPTIFAFEPDLPNATLYFYPRASTDVTVTLAVATHITAFADLTTDYTLPPGYKRYLTYALAQEVAPDFEREVPPSVARTAMTSRRAIQRLNHVTPQLSVAPPPESRLGIFRAGGPV